MWQGGETRQPMYWRFTKQGDKPGVSTTNVKSLAFFFLNFWIFREMAGYQREFPKVAAQFHWCKLRWGRWRPFFVFTQIIEFHQEKPPTRDHTANEPRNESFIYSEESSTCSSSFCKRQVRWCFAFSASASNASLIASLVFLSGPVEAGVWSHFLGGSSVIARLWQSAPAKLCLPLRSYAISSLCLLLALCSGQTNTWTRNWMVNTSSGGWSMKEPKN